MATSSGPAPTAAPSPCGPTGAAPVLAGLLLTAGVAHLVRPRAFAGLIPARLGPPGPWVLGSGVAELACGAALAVPATRRAGALAAAGLLVAVFPGNVEMAVRARRDARERPHPRRTRLLRITVARLPLQVPLVLWALRVARAAAGPATPAEGARGAA